MTSERQRDRLASARESFTAAREGAGTRAPELIAVDLRDAMERLAECLGEEVGDEVLDELFAKFCIGK